MRKYLVMFCFITLNLFSLIGQSRNSGTVTGILIENPSKQAIEFATITLLKKSNDSIVKVTASDSKGKFIFEKVADGEYYVSYSFLGYAKNSSAPFVISFQSRTVNLGELILEATSTELNEAVVIGDKSTFYNSIDRKTFNIGKDLMTTSGSVSDLMQNIPSLQVDIEGNVSLRGSENVQILINGKPSSLMGANRAAVLQQMPANTIEKIEVITNPSAKYKPDGTSGIINIVLKKNKNLGYNGTLIANAGNDDRLNASLTSNYNPGKFNIFGSYSIRQDDRLRFTSDFRQRKDSTSEILSTTDQIVNEHAQPLSHILHGGIDYELNGKNSLGISGSYNYRSFIRNGTNSYKISDSIGTLTQDYDRYRHDPEFENDLELIASYKHVFAEEHELSIEYNLSQSKEQEDNHYSNFYRIPVQPATFDNTLIQQAENESQFYVEYTNPVSDKTKLEAGYVMESRSSDMNFHGESLDPLSNEWIEDIHKTNRFKYYETIYSLYTTFEHEMGKFGFLAGLRAEQAVIESHLVTQDTIIPNNYFKIYPTMHIGYNLNASNELQLNYSHRVNRPEGDELNPFPEYQDPYNLRAGNPHLKPEDIHSLEAGYSYKHDNITFIATFYDRYIYNGKTEITRYINDSTLLTTRENLSKSNAAGLELIFSGSIGKLITINLNSNTFYNQIDASSLGFSAKKSNISWTANLNINTTLTKTTLLQLNSNYSSEKLTPQGMRLPTYTVNLGIRQELWKKRAAFIITVSDVFNTLQNNSILDTPLLYEKVIRKRSPRIIYAGLTFNLGKQIKKSKDEQLKFDNQL